MRGDRGIYVEIFIGGTIDEVWRLTQDPALHQRWDLRFSTIQYLPRESSSSPQRFLYATRVGGGMTIEGEGESVGEHLPAARGLRRSGSGPTIAGRSSVRAAATGSIFRATPESHSSPGTTTTPDSAPRAGCSIDGSFARRSSGPRLGASIGSDSGSRKGSIHPTPFSGQWFTRRPA